MLWKSLLLAAGVLAVVCAGQAAAGTGGADLPPSGGDAPRAPKHPAPGSGGHSYKAPDHARPTLTRLSVSRRSLFAFGRPVQVAFVIRDRSAYVRTRVAFVRVGSRQPVYTARLGRVRTGVTRTLRWRGTEGGRALRPGRYRVRVFARDRAGNSLRRRHSASSRAPAIVYQTHRFPVAGPHGYGGDGARFGAGREGHVHQGQDLPATEGTPVVAPRAATIAARGYDPAGAGNYLVLDARGEDFDYVFMHLQSEGLRVGKGDRVTTGERIANVGSTGHSTGPHLHFEIWRGPWFAGGKAIDPLPALRAWDRSS
ncbi:MAG: M23 family metallopeptidase [Solirubrobacterales bacterium]